MDGLGFRPVLFTSARCRVCRTAAQSGEDSHCIALLARLVSNQMALTRSTMPLRSALTSKEVTLALDNVLFEKLQRGTTAWLASDSPYPLKRESISDSVTFLGRKV